MSGARNQMGETLGKTWVMVVGAALGALTLLFFMGLVLLGISGREVPCSSRFLVVITLSLGAALAAAFLGGNAQANGSLPIPLTNVKPLTFSIAGGVGVLTIMLVLTNNLFASERCSQSVSVSCPIGYQPYVVDPLKFGFCYPREGWELDSSPVSVRAADIYVRRSDDRDIGIHFHLSLIPSAYAGQPVKYSDRVRDTWAQLDPKITTDKQFIGGREAFVFDLSVKNAKGREMRTNVTHVYLDDERLLEVISVRRVEDRDVLNVYGKIKSSLVFSRV